MTERKFTDEEVIKALEKIYKENVDVAEFQVLEPNSVKTLCHILNYVIDLINRQKAEIERLKAENRRMKKYYFTHDYHECHNEAIREFTDRLKEELRLSTGNNGGFVPSMIDNLVTEMTEGENES